MRPAAQESCLHLSELWCMWCLTTCALWLPGWGWGDSLEAGGVRGPALGLPLFEPAAVQAWPLRHKGRLGCAGMTEATQSPSDTGGQAPGREALQCQAVPLVERRCHASTRVLAKQQHKSWSHCQSGTLRSPADEVLKAGDCTPARLEVPGVPSCGSAGSAPVVPSCCEKGLGGSWLAGPRSSSAWLPWLEVCLQVHAGVRHC